VPLPGPPQRPDDVVTAFWLWTVALPLMIIGHISDVVAGPVSAPVLIGMSVLLALVVGAVVLTFLILMRAGYRWARTVLTAGALFSIVYTTASLFTAQRGTAAALIYAVTGITGAVLLGGGIVLLHRKDADAYFTR